METKVFFEDSNGHKVCGILNEPKNNQGHSIVILCHGRKSSKESKTNLKLQDIFAKHNLASFRFDFYGYGESEGNLDDLTLDLCTDDIISTINYLTDLGYSKIGIYAASFGCPPAVIATSQSSKILFLALKSPGMGQSSRIMPLIKQDFENKIWFEYGKKIKIPTLITHGTEDKDVELDQAIKLHESIKHSELKIIKGADHTYSDPKDFEEMIEIISKFIFKQFK